MSTLLCFCCCNVGTTDQAGYGIVGADKVISITSHDKRIWVWRMTRSLDLPTQVSNIWSKIEDLLAVCDRSAKLPISKIGSEISSRPPRMLQTNQIAAITLIILSPALGSLAFPIAYIWAIPIRILNKRMHAMHGNTMQRKRRRLASPSKKAKRHRRQNLPIQPEKPKLTISSLPQGTLKQHITITKTIKCLIHIEDDRLDALVPSNNHSVQMDLNRRCSRKHATLRGLDAILLTIVNQHLELHHTKTIIYINKECAANYFNRHNESTLSNQHKELTAELKIQIQQECTMQRTTLIVRPTTALLNNTINTRNKYLTQQLAQRTKEERWRFLLLTELCAKFYPPSPNLT